LKKIFWITISLLAVACVAFFIVRANSLALTLKLDGYSTSYALYERSFNANDREYRVIGTEKDGELTLLYLERSALGLWSIWYEGQSIGQSGWSRIDWTNTAGFRRFDSNAKPQFDFEYHQLYVGTNATRLIELEPTQLPPGISVRIQQSGKDFSIHLITFGDAGATSLQRLDMLRLLRDNADTAS